MHLAKVVEGEADWRLAVPVPREPGQLRLDHLPDANGPMAAGPGALERVRVVISRESVVRRSQPATGWVDGMRHRFERDQPEPLMVRVPAGAIAAFGGLAERDPAGALHGDVALDVGEDEVERRHVPRPQGLAEFGDGAGPAHRQQGRQPTAVIRPSHFSATGPVWSPGGGRISSTIGPLREKRTVSGWARPSRE